MISKFLSLILSFTLTIPVYSAVSMQIEKVYMKGDGCSLDDSAIVISPESSVVSVLFGAFQLSYPPLIAGPTGPKNFKNCDITLMVKTLKNTKIKTLDINFDLRGFAYLETGVNVNLTSRAFSVSRTSSGSSIQQTTMARHKLLLKKFIGKRGEHPPIESDFVIETQNQLKKPFLCTTKTSDKWRIVIKNKAMMMATGRAFHNNSIADFLIDSQDTSSKVQFKVTSAPCQ